MQFPPPQQIDENTVGLLAIAAFGICVSLVSLVCMGVILLKRNSRTPTPSAIPLAFWVFVAALCVGISIFILSMAGRQRYINGANRVWALSAENISRVDVFRVVEINEDVLIIQKRKPDFSISDPGQFNKIDMALSRYSAIVPARNSANYNGFVLHFIPKDQSIPKEEIVVVVFTKNSIGGPDDYMMELKIDGVGYGHYRNKELFDLIAAAQPIVDRVSPAERR